MSRRSEAIFERTFKEFVRNKAMLFWTIGWPVIWLILGSVVFTTGTPTEWLPQVKGSMTVSLIGFALMTGGIGNLAGCIARDKEKGAYHKIASMPVKPWEDVLGRLIGLFTFALVASIVILIIGLIIGARFEGGVTEALQGIAYAFLVILSSSGIGLIIGSVTKTEGTAFQIGIGIAVITATISGLFAPYSILPDALKQFSQLYPPSAATLSITYILQGGLAAEYFAGYNPLTLEHIMYTVISSVILFIVGLFLYEEELWAR